MISSEKLLKKRTKKLPKNKPQPPGTPKEPETSKIIDNGLEKQAIDNLLEVENEFFEDQDPYQTLYSPDLD
jgi:hypothetical protein